MSFRGPALRGIHTIFLDSNDLTNLKHLITYVESSANHVILLSRHTLERPYVLCELVYAAKHQKQIICVRLDVRAARSWDRSRARPMHP